MGLPHPRDTSSTRNPCLCRVRTKHRESSHSYFLGRPTAELWAKSPFHTSLWLECEGFCPPHCPLAPAQGGSMCHPRLNSKVESPCRRRDKEMCAFAPNMPDPLYLGQAWRNLCFSPSLPPCRMGIIPRLNGYQLDLRWC